MSAMTELVSRLHKGEHVALGSPEDVVAAVLGVRAGDDAALVTLTLGFTPLLRAQMRPFLANLSFEDAAMAAVIGLCEAARAIEDPAFFAAAVQPFILCSLKEAAAEAVAVAVPTRTLTRFYGILRRADGDLDAAAAIAPHYAMSRESFYAVASAVRMTKSIDGMHPAEFAALDEECASAPTTGDIEEQDLVAAAFGAVAELESEVIRSAYGFSDYRPKSDPEIAEELGTSKSSVQRTRTRGLCKMREALAVDVEG